MSRMHAQFWNIECGNCSKTSRVYGWEHEFPLDCGECGSGMTFLVAGPSESHGIITDDIPGGIMIRHAICNEDGTPKRYDSKTEIKRACNAKGYTIGGDTPVPYKV